MREIIFRGKRVGNGKWTYGQLINKKCIRDNGMPDRYFDWVECNYSYIYESNSENNIEEYPTKFVEVIPETVGQFTGLCDITGCPIYEGDIIKFVRNYSKYKYSKDYNFEVYFNKFLCHFALHILDDDSSSYVKDGPCDIMTLTGAKANDLQIIGNIQDNKSLSQTKKTD